MHSCQQCIGAHNQDGKSLQQHQYLKVTFRHKGVIFLHLLEVVLGNSETGPLHFKILTKLNSKFDQIRPETKETLSLQHHNAKPYMKSKL